MSYDSVVALGRGEIRVAEYSSYKTDISPVLNDQNCIGIAEECVLRTKVNFEEKRAVNTLSALRRMMTRNDLFVDFTVTEASRKNLNLLFSGDFTDNDFYLGGEDFSISYRIEIVFVYPDKVTTLKLVMPKCKITETSDFNLVNLSEPSKPAFTFQSLPLGNSTWGERLGRIKIS